MKEEVLDMGYDSICTVQYVVEQVAVLLCRHKKKRLLTLIPPRAHYSNLALWRFQRGVNLEGGSYVWTTTEQNKDQVHRYRCYRCYWCYRCHRCYQWYRWYRCYRCYEGAQPRVSCVMVVSFDILTF